MTKRVLVPGKLRDPAAPKMGRPTASDVRQRNIDEILDQVSAGQSLEEVCRGAGMPTPTEFRRWTRRDGELRKLWNMARRDYAHSLFDRMAAITSELATTDWGREDNPKVTALGKALDGLKHITARLHPEEYAEQKPGQQAIVVNLVTPLALRGGPEAPIDTAFRVVGQLPARKESDG